MQLLCVMTLTLLRYALVQHLVCMNGVLLL